MPIDPRPEILNAPTAHHGAFDYAELERLGLSPDAVIDFSVNSNPYGPPPGVRDALAAVPLDRYPDRESLALRRRLAERHGIGIENIIIGNGTAELLQLIAFAFINPCDDVLVVQPTFSEYERVAGLAGGNIRRFTMTAEDGFSINTDHARQFLIECYPKVAFVCNPNNPTGQIVNHKQLAEWTAVNTETLFVIDEAYINFAPGQHSTEILRHPPHNRDNVLIVRSLTKDYALAGLRLGYAMGAAPLIATLARLRPAWNVNALAQAAGIAVLDQGAWLNDTIAQLHENKRTLTAELTALGYAPLPSVVNYFLMRVGDAADFRTRLLKHNVMVRDATSFGLPEYVRIATRTPDENTKLIAAIKAIAANP